MSSVWWECDFNFWETEVWIEIIKWICPWRTALIRSPYLIWLDGSAHLFYKIYPSSLLNLHINLEQRYCNNPLDLNCIRKNPKTTRRPKNNLTICCICNPQKENHKSAKSNKCPGIKRSNTFHRCCSQVWFNRDVISFPNKNKNY